MRKGERTMRAMTFNLRFENDSDGQNSWDFRRNLVVETVLRYDPSILGTQEGTRNQLDYLARNLPGYRMHAPDRVWDDTCQYPTLFFREDQFDVSQGGDIWLSRTPNVHRSKSWDSAFPRMMSCGLFLHLPSKRELRVVVTHLDHMGAEARMEQAARIADWVLDRGGPCIVMGDFNDSPGSPVHRILTSSDTRLEDTWNALGGDENTDSMTYHKFQGIPQVCRMDWILVSRDFVVRDAVVIRDHVEGLYPSDHFPYMATLEWRG